VKTSALFSAACGLRYVATSRSSAARELRAAGARIAARIGKL
jgi:hypothetical protein